MPTSTAAEDTDRRTNARARVGTKTEPRSHGRLANAPGLTAEENGAGKTTPQDQTRVFWLHFRKVTRLFSFYACGRASAAEGEGAGRLVTLQEPCKIKVKHGASLWFIFLCWEILRMYSLRALFNP